MAPPSSTSSASNKDTSKQKTLLSLFNKKPSAQVSSPLTGASSPASTSSLSTLSTRPESSTPSPSASTPEAQHRLNPPHPSASTANSSKPSNGSSRVPARNSTRQTAKVDRANAPTPRDDDSDEEEYIPSRKASKPPLSSTNTANAPPLASSTASTKRKLQPLAPTDTETSAPKRAKPSSPIIQLPARITSTKPKAPAKSQLAFLPASPHRLSPATKTIRPAVPSPLLKLPPSMTTSAASKHALPLPASPSARPTNGLVRSRPVRETTPSTFDGVEIVIPCPESPLTPLPNRYVDLDAAMENPTIALVEQEGPSTEAEPAGEDQGEILSSSDPGERREAMLAELDDLEDFNWTVAGQEEKSDASIGRMANRDSLGDVSMMIPAVPASAANSPAQASSILIIHSSSAVPIASSGTAGSVASIMTATQSSATLNPSSMKLSSTSGTLEPSTLKVLSPSPPSFLPAHSSPTIARPISPTSSINPPSVLTSVKPVSTPSFDPTSALLSQIRADAAAEATRERLAREKLEEDRRTRKAEKADFDEDSSESEGEARSRRARELKKIQEEDSGSDDSEDFSKLFGSKASKGPETRSASETPAKLQTPTTSYSTRSSRGSVSASYNNRHPSSSFLFSSAASSSATKPPHKASSKADERKLMVLLKSHGDRKKMLETTRQVDTGSYGMSSDDEDSDCVASSRTKGKGKARSDDSSGSGSDDSSSTITALPEILGEAAEALRDILASEKAARRKERRTRKARDAMGIGGWPGCWKVDSIVAGTAGGDDSGTKLPTLSQGSTSDPVLILLNQAVASNDPTAFARSLPLLRHSRSSFQQSLLSPLFALHSSTNDVHLARACLDALLLVISTSIASCSASLIRELRRLGFNGTGLVNGVPAAVEEEEAETMRWTGTARQRERVVGGLAKLFERGCRLQHLDRTGRIELLLTFGLISIDPVTSGDLKQSLSKTIAEAFETFDDPASEIEFCQAALSFSSPYRMVFKRVFLAVFSRAGPVGARLSRAIGLTFLGKEFDPQTYAQAPTLDTLVMLVSRRHPVTQEPTNFCIDSNTDYIDLKAAIRIFAVVLADLQAIYDADRVQPESAGGAGVGIRRESSGGADFSRLVDVLGAADRRIKDGRAAHIERSVARAYLLNLTISITYRAKKIKTGRIARTMAKGLQGQTTLAFAIKSA